jgi:hypothetical protein
MGHLWIRIHTGTSPALEKSPQFGDANIALTNLRKARQVCWVNMSKIYGGHFEVEVRN